MITWSQHQNPECLRTTTCTVKTLFRRSTTIPRTSVKASSPLGSLICLRGLWKRFTIQLRVQCKSDPLLAHKFQCKLVQSQSFLWKESLRTKNSLCHLKNNSWKSRRRRDTSGKKSMTWNRNSPSLRTSLTASFLPESESENDLGFDPPV